MKLISLIMYNFIFSIKSFRYNYILSYLEERYKLKINIIFTKDFLQKEYLELKKFEELLDKRKAIIKPVNKEDIEKLNIMLGKVKLFKIKLKENQNLTTI